MVDATQVQIRRGTEAQISGFVPVEGEVICDLTNDTLRVGDGTKAGGHLMPNVARMQSGQYLFATAGGTGNAITVNLSPAVPALTIGMEFRFLAVANNTGSTTLNLNSLGNIGLRKIVNGSPTTLSTGDVRSGVIYSVVYDGSYFVLLSGVGGGAVAPAAGLTHDIYRFTPNNDWLYTSENAYPPVDGFSRVNRVWVAHALVSGTVTISFYHGTRDGAVGTSTRILLNGTVATSWSNVVSLEVFRQYDATVNAGDVITIQTLSTSAVPPSVPPYARIRNIKITSSTPSYGAVSG